MGKISILKNYIGYAFKITPFYTFFYLLLQLVNQLIPMVQIIIVSKFIDNIQNEILNKTISSQILKDILLLIFSFVFSYLLKLLSKDIENRLSKKANYEFELSVVTKHNRLSYAVLEEPKNNDLIERVSEKCDSAITSGLNSIVGFFDISIKLMGIVILLIRSSIGVSIIVFVMLFLLSFIACQNGEREYDSYKIATQRYRRAKSYSTMMNSREYADERRLFNYGEHINKMWEEEFESGRRTSLKATLVNFIRIKGLSIVMTILSFGIGAVMLIPLHSGRLTTGLYISIVTEVFNMVHTMSWALAQVIQSLILMKDYMLDYSSFLELPELDDIKESKDIDLEVNTVTFRNVSFKYPNTDNWAIHDLNLQLDKGKTYGFVGENGAGKSTVIKLLLGVYKDYEGEILINDMELKDIPSYGRYKFFSVVYQDFARYQISALDNILIGKIESIENEDNFKSAEKIIQQVGLTKALNSLPNKLNTELGQLGKQGHDLSGGEWQKLAIARALYGNNPIQILDEPTSSLDSIIEKQIYDCFYNISSGSIKIMISHRLGGIKDADEIIVFSDGRVAEKGTHQKLLDKEGIYAEMYENQRWWYGEQEESKPITSIY